MTRLSHPFGSRTRGFLIYFLLAALIIMGILVFALQAYSRQQNLSAHRIAYGQVCEALARSGVTVVLTRFKETLRWNGKLIPFLSSGAPLRLTDLIRSKPDELNARFASSEANSGPFFEELLGPDYRYPIDRLAREVPGSKIEVFLSLRAAPLYTGVGVEDPVEKTVDLTLTGRASLMGVTRRVRTGFQLKIVNPIAPLAAKFSLFVSEPDANYNGLDNDAAGRPTATARPMIVYNTPPEDRTEGYDDASLMARNADFDEIREAVKRRGYVYLGSKSGSILNLTAGNEAFGEFFHLYSAQRFANGQLYTRLFSPPPFFNSFQNGRVARDHRYENDESYQYPFMSQIYFGFYKALKGDPVLGDSLTDEGRSSLLHLYGDVTNPSRTVVYGPVIQAICKVSRAGMDSVPKSDSTTFVTAPSPTYKKVPYFPYCPNSSAYEADLKAEQGGQDPTYLAKIRSEYAPGRPGIQSAFAMVPETYTHSKMFGDKYDAYQGQMSRVDQLPYVEMADAMRYPNYFPPTAPENGQQFQSCLDKPYAHYQAAQDVQLPFSDSIHRQMGQADYYRGNLGDFFTSHAASPGTSTTPVETILRSRVLREVADQAEFLSTYASTGILSITDCVKILDGGLTLPAMSYRGQGLVVVQKGDLVLGGIRPVPSAPGELPSVLTLATLDGDIRLAAGTFHSACFVAPKGAIQISGAGVTQIMGSLAAATLPPSSFGEGVSLQYPSHIDPTRSDDPASARYVDYYLLAMGSMPVTVERLP